MVKFFEKHNATESEAQAQREKDHNVGDVDYVISRKI